MHSLSIKPAMNAAQKVVLCIGTRCKIEPPVPEHMETCSDKFEAYIEKLHGGAKAAGQNGTLVYPARQWEFAIYNPYELQDYLDAGAVALGFYIAAGLIKYERKYATSK